MFIADKRLYSLESWERVIKTIRIMLIASIIGIFCNSVAIAEEANKFSEYVDEQGNITFPIGYRGTFTHLGTYSVASKMGGTTDELHGVYTRPEDAQAYKRDGRFPDGAILIKEVLATKSEPLTTGDVTWASKAKVWFVMIKDSTGRFKGNDLWGDGWGWALFEAKEPLKQVSHDYKSECRACHVPAKKDDWLYIGRFSDLQMPLSVLDGKKP